MSIFDLFRRKSGTASPSPDSERGDWVDWFLNREGPAGRFRGNRRPRYGINYLFNDGGSVNPHEETKRAARDWSPREQYISRSNRDRTQDAAINRFIREGQGKQQQWEQGGGQGAYPVFNQPGTGANSPVSPGWLQASSQLGDNSGVMAAMANNAGARNIYDLFAPDVDIDDEGLWRNKVTTHPTFTGETYGWGGSFPLLGGEWDLDFEKDFRGSDWTAGITGTWDW